MYAASSHPESKHFDNQAGRYRQQEKKPMKLDKKEIYKYLENVFHPG